MITATGAEYHLGGLASLQPGGRPIKVDDLAHQLALINRFHGATCRPYSVAEHSLLVSEVAERAALPMIVQLAALLHDAHEVYTQDVATPVKRAVDFCSGQSGGTSAWTQFEADHAKTLRRHFGLLTTFASSRFALRHIDLQALATERRDLLPFDPYLHQPWPVLGDHEDDLAKRVTPIDWCRLNTPEREAMRWQDWRQAWRDRFDELQHGLGLLNGTSTGVEFVGGAHA
jgi:predicted HD phosphohydrolase